MTEAVRDTVPCRPCTNQVVRGAVICSSCGVKEPWIPDEPAMNPRVIRLAKRGGRCCVLAGLLLLLFSVVMFGPAEDERDEQPRGAKTERHESG